LVDRINKIHTMNMILFIRELVVMITTLCEYTSWHWVC
jgi:hypothetical protein